MKFKTFPRQTGFTLVEIMIVVAIIGLLAAIALPNFLRARSTAQQDSCINNLRQIDYAKQEWTLEEGKWPGATPTGADLQGYLGRGMKGTLPWCPLAGSDHAFADSYAPNSIGTAPVCQLGGVSGSKYDPAFVHAVPY